MRDSKGEAEALARKGEGAERTHPQEVCLDENQGQRVDKGLAGHGTRSGRVEYPLKILRGDCQKGFLPSSYRRSEV